MSFYNNYVYMCNKVNKSPSAVAEEMGYQRSVITRWSKGTAPRQATLQRVAEYFGCSVSDLTVDHEENKNPALIDENGMDEITIELLKIANEIDAADRQLLLDMALSIKKRRES